MKKSNAKPCASTSSDLTAYKPVIEAQEIATAQVLNRLNILFSVNLASREFHKGDNSNKEYLQRLLFRDFGDIGGGLRVRANEFVGSEGILEIGDSKLYFDRLPILLYPLNTS
jgi:hypothetical protein